jgi:Flp pilus assembly pilin Flp
MHNQGSRLPSQGSRAQGSSASLIELALIIVLIAIVVLAILLIVGDDLRLWVVDTLQGFLKLTGK